MVAALRVDLRDNAVEWLQLAVPAALYTLQNVMLFVGAAHLEAAIAQVTYQAKILFTAVFSVLLLGEAKATTVITPVGVRCPCPCPKPNPNPQPGKRLSPNQWLGLAMLVVGVLCVQGVMDQLIPSFDTFAAPASATATATATAIAPAAAAPAIATAATASAAAAASPLLSSLNVSRRGGKANMQAPHHHHHNPNPNPDPDPSPDPNPDPSPDYHVLQAHHHPYPYPYPYPTPTLPLPYPYPYPLPLPLPLTYPYPYP